MDEFDPCFSYPNFGHVNGFLFSPKAFALASHLGFRVVFILGWVRCAGSNFYYFIILNLGSEQHPRCSSHSYIRWFPRGGGEP